MYSRSFSTPTKSDPMHSDPSSSENFAAIPSGEGIPQVQSNRTSPAPQQISSEKEIPVEAFDQAVKEEFLRKIHMSKDTFRSDDPTSNSYDSGQDEYNQAPAFSYNGQSEGCDMAQDSPCDDNRVDGGPHPQDKKEERGLFASLRTGFSKFGGGFLKDFSLDDVILIAIILYFLFDKKEDNDILIPILLGFLLFF